MQLSSQSPQKISIEAGLTEDYLPVLSLQSIEHDLRIQYGIYRQNKIPQTFLKKAAKALNKIATYTLGFLHQFWREIIPEIVRGPMPVFSPPASSKGEERERVFFQEFIKKRTPFFLIVYKSDCLEEEIQEAYICATNLVPEGISIKHEELGNETAYQQWRIGNTATVEKYSIHVLQFDVFHKLLWFGTLTKGLMTAAAEPAELMDQFRREVKAAIKAYEKTEHSFLGSYVEKQDRFALDPVEDK